MLGAMALVGHDSKPPKHRSILPLFVVIVTGGILVYGTLDMPAFGDGSAPANVYPDPSYVERTAHDIHVPNVVTAVLGSYRGYDTLGETVVIFTAGIGVLVLLRGSRARRTVVETEDASAEDET
jgi:multicomponent Na+:H+ antiporter subunit B